jgi:hypothetical protein
VSVARAGTLVWFGLLAAPAAWAAQHVVGFGLTVAACGAPGRAWGIDVTPWTIALTVAAALVAVLAEVAAAAVLRATRDAGEEPPGSRIRFLSIVGLTTNPLFLCIIVLSGTGVSVLDGCRIS